MFYTQILCVSFPWMEARQIEFTFGRSSTRRRTRLLQKLCKARTVPNLPAFLRKHWGKFARMNMHRGRFRVPDRLPHSNPLRADSHPFWTGTDSIGDSMYQLLEDGDSNLFRTGTVTLNDGDKSPFRTWTEAFKYLRSLIQWKKVLSPLWPLQYKAATRDLKNTRKKS